MPHKSHKRWMPAYGEGGPIGKIRGMRDRVDMDVPTPTDDFTLGRSSVERPYFIRHKARAESVDDEMGAVSRYSNPAGFHGLYGNQVDYNQWQKDLGQREVKRRTGPGVHPLKGMPFKSGGKG